MTTLISDEKNDCKNAQETQKFNWLSFLLFIFFLIIFVASPVFATTHNVSSSQDLFEAQRQAVDGDTIMLHPNPEPYTGTWIWEDFPDEGFYHWNWYSPIYPYGKNLIYTSTNPDDPAIVSLTILTGVISPNSQYHQWDGMQSCACHFVAHPLTDGGYRIPNCQMNGLTIICGGGWRSTNSIAVVCGGGGDLVISSCTFIGDSQTENIGAVEFIPWTNDYNLTIDHCTFNSIDNLVCSLIDTGYVNDAKILNSHISNNNQTGLSGPLMIGAFYANNLTIRNTTITGNNGTSIYAENIGWYDNGSITINDCVIDGTDAIQGGMVLTVAGSSGNITITNNTIKNNSYNGGISASVPSPGSILIQDCTISGNYEEYDGQPNGGGINISGANATIDNCAVIDNESACLGGGGIFVQASNTTITKCTIARNYVSDVGGGGLGGGIWNSAAGTKISHCIIKENRSAYRGGGIFSSFPLDIINCMITDNNSDAQGGGIYLTSYDNVSNIINCTVAGNSAIDYGGAYLDYRVDLINSIIWENSPEHKQLYTFPRYDFSENEYGYTDISNCDIENSKSFVCNSKSYLVDSDFPDDCGYLGDYFMGKNAGDNLLPPQNPQFIYGYHIRETSPCVNAGDNDAVIAFGITVDIDLVEDRIIGGIVDIGADEVGGGGGGGKYFPDYNSDNFVNFLDFAVFANYWLTENPFISLDEDGDVDIYDLKIFCNYWLEGTAN
jgi:hypothetical protein